MSIEASVTKGSGDGIFGARAMESVCGLAITATTWPNDDVRARAPSARSHAISLGTNAQTSDVFSFVYVALTAFMTTLSFPFASLMALGPLPEQIERATALCQHANVFAFRS